MADEPQLDRDAEALLATFSEIAESVRSDPGARFVIFDGVQITGETAEWPVAMLLLAPGDAWMETKARIIESGLAEVLLAWQASEHFYLAALDDRREGATARPFVDHVTSRRDFAEALLAFRGTGGRIRTRAEMLSEPDARLAEALSRWEAGEDSVQQDRRRERVDLITSKAPSARAQLRWGMVRPEAASEGDRVALEALHSRFRRAKSHLVTEAER